MNPISFYKSTRNWIFIAITNPTDNRVDLTADQNELTGWVSHNRYKLNPFTIWVNLYRIIFKNNPNCIRIGRKPYGHKTVTVNHITIVTNHSIYIITKSKRNVIVFRIEIGETTCVYNRYKRLQLTEHSF